jgi:hypothetical protein
VWPGGIQASRAQSNSYVVMEEIKESFVIKVKQR